MTRDFVSDHELSVTQGGSGGPLLVLLHGLGANRTVWQPMTALAEKHWPGRWLAPDLRGHGRSSHKGPYGYATHAADIADLIANEPDGSVTLLGHSFGGVVAALVGSGWFGPKVAKVAAFGVKIVWSARRRSQGARAGAAPRPRIRDPRRRHRPVFENLRPVWPGRSNVRHRRLRRHRQRRPMAGRGRSTRLWRGRPID